MCKNHFITKLSSKVCNQSGKAKYLFLIKGRNFSENKMLGISDNKSKLVPSIAVLAATVPTSLQIPAVSILL